MNRKMLLFHIKWLTEHSTKRIAGFGVLSYINDLMEEHSLIINWKLRDNYSFLDPYLLLKQGLRVK